MGYARNVVAFPFYVLALVFHLLTALLTAIAQKIAGDESEPSRRQEAASLVTVAVLAIVAVPAWVASNPPAIDWSRLTPKQPMDYRAAKAGFTPEQMVWVRSLIRLTACTFAEKAVRHRVEPMPVGFAPCGDRGGIQTILADNLIDVVVSGVATIGEKIERPFKVTLQHYPPSIDEDGFLIIAIDLDTDGVQVSGGAS
jgi:hypothetical protein